MRFMRFQERDGQILLTIYEYGGVLARRHLKLMFFPNTTLRMMQMRLSKLISHGYLARPTREHRRTQPIPEQIYWLNWKGIIWVAAQNNVGVTPPANVSEYQMRGLAKQLRDQGIHWLREPRWIQLRHDLACVDARLEVEKAINEVPTLDIELWHHEDYFRSARNKHIMEFQTASPGGTVKLVKKWVYPDLYCEIVDRQRLAQGLLARARLLWEIDNATHTKSRFARDKVLPGLAYIKSPEYKARFGANSGRWLVVTTGEVRMGNLMRQTQQVDEAGARTFLFTTFDQVETGNVLTEPIWWQAGRKEPIALFPRDELK